MLLLEERGLQQTKFNTSLLGPAARLQYGIDGAYNQAVVAFAQKCATAAGNAQDGQADYCVSLDCETCATEAGCGWCGDRHVCSNMCVSTDGECAMEAGNAGAVDECAAITDCKSCNKAGGGTGCGWCLHGARNVCSANCDHDATISSCDADNQHVHDAGGGADSGNHGDPGGDVGGWVSGHGTQCDEDSWGDSNKLFCGECRVLVDFHAYPAGISRTCSSFCQSVQKVCIGA
eukprot:SAG22_NODE_2980_length_2055_cov_1.562372_2_plen_233_part_00